MQTAWVGIWLTVVTGILAPLVRGVWTLSMTVQLLQAALEQQSKYASEECGSIRQQIHDVETDLAMEVESGKVQDRKLAEIKEVLGGMNAKLDILVNRAGLNNPVR